MEHLLFINDKCMSHMRCMEGFAT